MVDPIPAGCHSVTPYLMMRDGARAIAFCREALGAQELMRFNDATFAAMQSAGASK
jgi:uncharacterized glyoxalase superfamily protein PhnB